MAGRLTLMLRDNHQEEMTDGARSDAQERPKREDYDTVFRKTKCQDRGAPCLERPYYRWTDDMVKVKRSGDGGRGRSVKLVSSG